MHRMLLTTHCVRCCSMRSQPLTHSSPRPLASRSSRLTRSTSAWQVQPLTILAQHLQADKRQ